MLQFKSVLIVDDDPICVFLCKRELQKAGIVSEIYTAQNGEGALDFIIEYYKQHKALPDVILFDIRMPVMNGIEFAKQLNRLPFFSLDETILACVSSSQNMEDVSNLKSLGVNYMFAKPMLQEYIRNLKLIKIKRERPELYERVFRIYATAFSKAS